MSLWHDRDMLVDHLRYTFVTSDDTACSESVVQLKPSREKPGGVRLLPGISRTRQRRSSITSEESDITSEGPAIDRYVGVGLLDLEQSGSSHRSRSRTYAKLEEVRAKKKQRKNVRTVSGKVLNESETQSNGLFVYRCVADVAQEPVESLASKLLLDAGSKPKNPFQAFAKFDASTNVTDTVKKLCILVPPPHCSPDNLYLQEQPPVQLQIFVEGEVQIRNVTGLACYQYFAQNYQPPFPEPPPRFELVGCLEETVEFEAGCCAPKDRLRKYDFEYFTLRQARESPGIDIHVTVHADLGEPLVLTYCNEKPVTVREIRDKATEHFYPSDSPMLIEYNLEDYEIEGHVLPVDQLLPNLKIRTFYLVRCNAARASPSMCVTPTNDSKSEPHHHSVSGSPYDKSTSLPTEHAFSSHRKSHYKSMSDSRSYGSVTTFKVDCLKKFGKKAVTLNMGPDKVEIIDGGNERRSSPVERFLRSSSGLVTVYSMNNIGGLTTVSSSKLRTIFKLHYLSGNDFKHHQFEADDQLVFQLRQKLQFYAVQAGSSAWQKFHAETANDRKVSASRFGRIPKFFEESQSVASSDR